MQCNNANIIIFTYLKIKFLLDDFSVKIVFKLLKNFMIFKSIEKNLILET